MMEHFADKEPEYFLKVIGLLVQRCEKCVGIKGDCIEKWQSCFISVTLKSWSCRKLLDPTTYSGLLCSASCISTHCTAYRTVLTTKGRRDSSASLLKRPTQRDICVLCSSATS